MLVNFEPIDYDRFDNISNFFSFRDAPGSLTSPNHKISPNYGSSLLYLNFYQFCIQSESICAEKTRAYIIPKTKSKSIRPYCQL